MANDASNHPTNSSDADMNMSGDHAEFDAVQLAQANAPQQPQQPQKTAAIPAVPNGTVHVEVPQGEKVVRVEVANGETVVLPAPFDDQAALAAKEGNGNLAIKVGDITVILEGYQQTVDASGNPTVTLQDQQGDKIDIATVLASTDPNLDIETAAGPAAGAQGADNTGALLSAFAGAGGLGGLNAVGVLDATALQYTLIDNAIRLDREDPLETPDNPVIVTPPPPPGPNDNPLNFVTKGTAVFENALGIGTDPASPNEVTKGTVHIEAKDGVATITIAGVPVDLTNPANTPTIPGTYGDLKVTGWDPVTGDLTYTFTLTTNDPTHGKQGTDVELDELFPITATDKDGDTDTGDLQIGIVDDVPTAKNDGISIGSANSHTSTVAENVENNDIFGADGKTAGGGVVGVVAGDKGGAASTGVGTDIQGTYGKLHLNADGSYTYTRNDGKPLTAEDNFTYTIKDGDGDTSTAVLNIKIDDKDIKITDLTPKLSGGDVTVDEDGLLAARGPGESAGSDGSGPVKADGDFTITSPDGVQNLSIDGHAVITNGVFAATSFTTGMGNTLNVTGFDPATGKVTYSYTLVDNENHPSANGENSLFEDLNVIVTDKDGDQASDTLSVNIVDDVPTAKNDTDLVTKGTNTATGDVITGAGTTSGPAGADVKGADGATVSGLVGSKTSDSDASNGLEVQGTYGKLVMNADGTYTYTRDAGTPGGVTDTFTYTLTDGDGDKSSATLTINVDDDKPTVDVPTADGMTKVFEKGLPQGSGELADGNSGNNSDKSEAVSGTITYTEGDAPATITIQGKDGPIAVVAGATIVGADGTLVINAVGGGKIDYTYTLTTNTSGDTTHDDFKVVVTDADGDPANGTLVINIVDDVPTAKNDTDLVSNATNTATGNVVTGADTTSGAAGADTKGADGASVSKLVGFGGSTDSTAADGLTVVGQHGTLTMNADGTYTYTRFDGKPLTADDTFTYTLTDGDGDTSTATLKVSIDDKDIKITDLTPKANGGDVTVDEDDLSAGRGAGESGGSDTTPESATQGGTFTITSPDGVQSLTIGGVAVITNGVFTATSIDTGMGNKLNITGFDPATGTVTYTYTLLDNETHPSANGENSLFEDFPVVVTDKDGDTASDTLSVNIVDDVPTARNDSDVVDNATNTATGNVVTGAGTNGGLGGVGADTKGADNATVSGLSSNSTGKADTDASDGLTVQGQFGKLTMNADGTYTYTRDPGTPGGASETFTYTLKDSDGDTSTATLTVGISDKNPDIDAPTAAGETTVYEKGLPQGSGEMADGNSANNSDKSEVVSGTIKYDEGDAPASITIQGKDGPVAVTVGATIVGADGTLVVTSVGGGSIGYTYTLTTNTSGDATTDSFKLSITDKDGDNATDNLVIKIVDDVPTAKNDTDSVGNLKSTDGNVITGVGTTSGAAGIDLKGADGAVVSQATGFNGSKDTDAAGGFTVQGQYGKLVLNPDGSYTYTRDTDGPLTATDNFTYTLKDGDGDTSTATLQVTIKDDGCEIKDLTPSAKGGDTLVDEDGLLASRGAGESAGSDGSGPTKGDGDFTITAPDGVQNLSVDGHQVITNGVFTAASWTTGFGNTMSVTGYDANTGKVTYNYTLNDNESHSKGGGENSLFEDLNVSLTDKDGDTANGTLSVNIVDDVPVGTSGDKVLGANPEKNNVLLVLDITGSMGVKYPTDNSPTNKLQFEVQAAKNLLDAYLAAGNGDGANLRVQIVTFSVKAQAWTTEWVDIQEAKEILNQIGAMTPAGNTNYDAGIQQALAVTWTPAAGAITGATNSTYFFSDGLPNENNDGTNGLNGAQATAWLNELKADDINAYAIGMIDASQVDPAAAQNELNKIAYNGKTETDTNAIVVTDPSQLTAQIVATIVNKGEGSIVGDLGGKYGADGGSGVNSITLNGKTYTFDGVNAITTTGASADVSSFNAATHVLTITTSIGKFTIDMDDGKYTYEQKGGVETAVDVGWTIIDKDGDVSNPGTLHLLAPIPVVTLAADPDLPAVGDFNAAHKQIGLNDSATLTGNADGGGDYLDGTFGNHTMKGGLGDDLYVVNGNDTVVEQYKQGHDTVQASVTYTLTNAVEDLVLTGANNINGTGNDSDNTIVGNSGNNVLTGGSGNDILIGGAGADTMKGDAGNDQFLHVDKADLTSGGVNGGDGDDLVDLSGLTTFKSADGDHSKISNVEILSFTGGNAAGTQVALDYNSVLTMTDANNNLVIHGDQGKDTVALSGGFTKIGTDVAANDGAHYDVFQAGSGANLVTVFVDHNLNATAS